MTKLEREDVARKVMELNVGDKVVVTKDYKIYLKGWESWAKIGDILRISRIEYSLTGPKDSETFKYWVGFEECCSVCRTERNPLHFEYDDLTPMPFVPMHESLPNESQIKSGSDFVPTKEVLQKASEIVRFWAGNVNTPTYLHFDGYVYMLHRLSVDGELLVRVKEEYTKSPLVMSSGYTSSYVSTSYMPAEKAKPILDYYQSITKLLDAAEERVKLIRKYYKEIMSEK